MPPRQPRWVLTRPGRRAPGPREHRSTFDDEAALGYSGTAPPGSERACGSDLEAAAASDYLPLGLGTWSVRARTSLPVQTTFFTATITWSDCDADNDSRGRQDRRQLRRRLQHRPDATLDADRSGDACDPDDDNDGVADTSDNCRVVGQRRPGRLGRRPRRQRLRQHPRHGTGAPPDPDRRRPDATTADTGHPERLHQRLRLRPHGRPAPRREEATGWSARSSRWRSAAAARSRSRIWRKRSGADRKLVVVDHAGDGEVPHQGAPQAGPLLRQRRVGRRAAVRRRAPRASSRIRR